jgi:2-keto-4-pentenoate hydratase/2-oxohepta-3-ene-1,7-dioic acid hydratase in catechol pathway
MPQRPYPPAIYCIGRNYAEHAAEMGNDPLEHPILFFKNPASVIGDGDAIVIHSICDEPSLPAGEGLEVREIAREQVDYEGELAVVLARDCRDVPERDALACISGYAAANDVSARWWQRHGSGGQYSRGKSFDTFCPIGPVTPASKVPDPQNLRLVTRLNGEVVQDANTSTMIFSVARLIAELSRGMTLMANSIILTGTPSGVGAARKPPRFLKDGDVIEVEIESVGRVRNRVRHE